MNILMLIITIIIVAIGVAFSLLNSQLVNFNYFIGQHVIPLSLLLVLSLGIGILLGWLVSVPDRISKRTQIYRLRRQLKQTNSDKGA